MPRWCNITLVKAFRLKFTCGTSGYVELVEQKCMLVSDEKSITPGQCYDTGTNTYYGNVTLPGDTGIENHALVFMLAGISARWKQVVAYYFTSSKGDGRTFKPIIIEILQKAEELG